MKIAVLGPAYPFRGGIAHHTGMLVKNLIKEGNEVVLFSFRRQFPKFIFPGKTQFDLSASIDAPPAEPIFIPWKPKSWKNVSLAVSAEDFDVFVCIYWTPFTALGYAKICHEIKRKGKIPILFLLHNVIPHERLPLVRYFSRKALSKADGIIAQSRAVEEEYLDFVPQGSEKWREVVPHPVYNFQEYSSPSKESARKMLGIKESKSLLYFGLIRGYKGLQVLIEAFPAISQEFSNDIRLVIAGEFYDHPEPYLDLIKKLDITDNITIHNRFIPNEEVGRYFSAVDAVVLPYLTASQSGVVQAAFGFEKPVISTKVGGLPEAVSEGITGVLCDPNDPESLAEAVIKFYKLSKTVDWKKNIVAERDRFSWNNFSKAISRFLEKIPDK
jgi:D-inositol-3-phosphate glycosyltransferase